jgi:hypothetical protein
MATFAIVRADGSVDKVDGASVEDVSNRFGAPGNGSIEAWDEGSHGAKLANTFDSPEAQYAAWQKVAEAEGQNDPGGSANKAVASMSAGPSAADVAVQVLVATHSRAQLDELAASKGIEDADNLGTKADVAAAIVAATTED